MARSTLRESQVFDSDFVAPEEHEGLHDRDLYVELLRSYGKVVQVDEWSDVTKTKQISSTVLTRQLGKVHKTIKSIYDYSTGTSIIATVTGTINRVYGQVVDIEYTRDNDMEGL